MNPKRCMKCLLHGDSTSHGPTLCPVSKCHCRKCQLIDKRRKIANRLVKVDRDRRILFGIRDTNSGYSCSRCRSHGTLVIKKNHTPCPFSHCKCEPCLLHAEKKLVENELTQIYRSTNAEYCSQSDSDSDRSPQDNGRIPILAEAQNLKFNIPIGTNFDALIPISDELTPEAKVIVNLIEVLSVDPNSFDPDSFDTEALLNFMNKESILLPDSWLPELSNIFDLVHEALKRFPTLRAVDFPTGIQ